MIRPVDWHPLAEADPLPGDPDAITVESARLARLGDDMRTQAARLRQIGADTTLVGAYAEELRSAAGDLAQDLDKVSGRYERVASALKDWAPELAVAQAETLRARSRATEAEQLWQANGGAPNWGQDSWQFLPLVPVSEPLSLQDARARFLEAQRMLRDTLEHAEARGRHYARLIDDANDIFKDSGWDNFKDWADRNADWIDQWSNRLGWVATAAAIGAIFIPGVNVVAFGYLATALTTTAMAATAVAASGHLVLASSGNGSWVDFGLDVFALVTLGVGLHAANALKSAQQATRLAASQQARLSASEAVLRTRRETVQAAQRVLDRASSSEASKAAARATIAKANEVATRAGDTAAGQVLNAATRETRLAQRFAIGDRDLASAWDDIAAFSKHFPHAPAVLEAAERGGHAYRTAQNSYLLSTTVDMFSKASERYSAGRWPFTSTSSAW